MSVTPAEGNVELAHDANFILTVEASDENLYELEVDHNIKTYQNSAYMRGVKKIHGTADAQGDFAEYGVSVSYDAAV